MVYIGGKETIYGTKADNLENIFRETFNKSGKIDVIVVNAGGAVENAEMGSVAAIGEENYDKYMNLNLKSIYFTVQKALPYMNESGRSMPRIIKRRNNTRSVQS